MVTINNFSALPVTSDTIRDLFSRPDLELDVEDICNLMNVNEISGRNLITRLLDDLRTEGIIVQTMYRKGYFRLPIRSGNGGVLESALEYAREWALKQDKPFTRAQFITEFPASRFSKTTNPSSVFDELKDIEFIITVERNGGDLFDSEPLYFCK